MHMGIDQRKRLFFALLAVICLLSSGWIIIYYHLSPWYGIHAEFDDESGQARLTRIPPDSPTARAGLREGDAVLSYNGNRIETEEDVNTWLNEARYSAAVRLEIQHGEDISEIVLQSGLRPFRFIHLAFALVGLLFILMGFWVFYARPRYTAANTWGIFSLLMGTFILASGRTFRFDDPVVIFFALLLILQMIFAITAALHFALVFPKKSKLAKKRWTVITLYAISTFLAITAVPTVASGYLLDSVPPALSAVVESLQYILLSSMFLYIGLTVIVLLATYVRTGDSIEKRRIRWIIFGTAIPLGFILTISILNDFLNIYIPYLTWLVIIVFATIPVTCFYAIVRHRAMKMELIIRRGLIYALVTGAVLLATGFVFAFIFGLPLLLQGLIQDVSGQRGALSRFALDPTVQHVTIAAWAVVVGATVGKLKRRAQEFVDRRFYREKYNYRQTLRQLVSVLDKAADRERLLEIASENVEQLVHPRSLVIALISEDSTAVVAHAVPEAPSAAVLDAESTATLLDHFERGKRYLGRREMEEESSPAAEAIRAVFDLLGADLCLPMKAEGEILGLLFLGGKRSELAYNMEDIELLGLLADQAAHSLEHMRLAEAAVEKERIQRELQIGRDIQRSLLPLSPPRLEGASIAALNIPAMEVGGDFYTFIEYGPRKVGIIVGDIVGKGVAGAINMAATISSLRLIAEESDSAAEAMERLNRYLVRTSNSRSFAAVAFAVFDLDAMSLRWSNAGLPEPVVISRGGGARFLEMEAYPLPPGASDRSDYREASYLLQPGDTVVIVTDGVIEARPADGSGDDFGFDRLLRLLGDCGDAEPEALLRTLADTLRSFRGVAEFEDDLTAVAVRIRA